MKVGDKWFITGDAFVYDHEYRLKFMDRLGDTYRWKGENTSTEEVTNVRIFHSVAPIRKFPSQIPCLCFRLFMFLSLKKENKPWPMGNKV